MSVHPSKVDRYLPVVVAALLLGTVGDLKGAAAETPPAATTGAPPAATAAPAPAAPVAADKKVIVNPGFRSARFGMSEAEVRAAITRDFGAAEVPKASTNPTEQTQLLTVRVPDLLPGGGVAEVAYVMGYKSKKLIQVNVVWSKATDPKMTAERLFANAEILRADLADKGYRPESVAAGTPVRGGLLMFRGEDAEDHVTALVLQGTMAPGTDKDQKVLTPVSLLLFYTADAKKPDIFRLAPGQF